MDGTDLLDDLLWVLLQARADRAAVKNLRAELAVLEEKYNQLLDSSVKSATDTVGGFVALMLKER